VPVEQAVQSLLGLGRRLRDELEPFLPRELDQVLLARAAIPAAGVVAVPLALPDELDWLPSLLASITLLLSP
jgi:hypothetical protein